MKCVVISRERDVERRTNMMKSLRDIPDWEFLNATDGHAPEQVPVRYSVLCPKEFWGGKVLKPGAIGAFISHFRAWEKCLAEDRPVVVLEDDIEVLVGSKLEQLLEEVEEQQADLVFINERMSSWAAPIRGEQQFVDLADVIRFYEAAGHEPAARAPGGDGYVIFPAAAAALIDLARASGAVVGVDWFLVAASLRDQPEPGNWRAMSIARRCVGQSTDTVLTVLIRTDPLVMTDVNRAGSSVIRHDKVVSITSYAESLANGKLAR